MLYLFCLQGVKYSCKLLKRWPWSMYVLSYTWSSRCSACDHAMCSWVKTRQDDQSSTVVYWNSRYCIEFLDESFFTHKNSLPQKNLPIDCIVLYFCLYSSIFMSTRWLAGNSHLLSNHDWSISSMQRVVKKWHDAHVRLNLMDHCFLMRCHLKLWKWLSTCVSCLREEASIYNPWWWVQAIFHELI